MIEIDAAQLLAGRLASLSLAEYGLPEVTVVQRMLDGTDPNLSVGIFLYSWSPVEQPNIGGLEPAIGRFRYYIQTFVKSSVREEGEVWSMALCKKIRNLIYRDTTLRSSLASLYEQEEDRIERSLRYGVEQSEYQDAPITGGFAFFSQTAFWLETEVV